MATNSIKSWMREVFDEIYHRQNVDALDEYLADDFTAHDIPPAYEPNRDGAKQFLRSLLTAFPDYRVTVEDQIVEGDRVVTRFTANATHQGVFMGIQPTGKSITLPGIVIHRIADNQVHDEWIRVDQLGLMQQLGVVPMPTE